MLPNGCFGSTLAYAPKSAVCIACPATVECGAIVTNRHPRFLMLLQRFNDSDGTPMSEQWLSDAEKAERKKEREQALFAEAIMETFGDAAVAARLRASLDKRVHPTLDKCIRRRINPMNADLRRLATISKPMKSAITALQAQPQTLTTIAAAIASDASVSASTAKRHASAVVTFLKRCGRIAERNNKLEIQ
jgi:uncharacterized protein with PIN domain